jgi:hypothetical protein
MFIESNYHHQPQTYPLTIYLFPTIISAIGDKAQAISDDKEGTIRVELRSGEQGERLAQLIRLNE